MKKLALVVFALVLSTGSIRAQNNTTRFFYQYDHETITVSTTAIGFTTAKVNAAPIGAQLVTVTIECASGTTCTTRFLADGTTPTSSVGQQVDYQYSFSIYGHDNIVRFLAIRSASTDSKYQVAYYR